MDGNPAHALKIARAGFHSVVDRLMS